MIAERKILVLGESPSSRILIREALKAGALNLDSVQVTSSISNFSGLIKDQCFQIVIIVLAEFEENKKNQIKELIQGNPQTKWICIQEDSTASKWKASILKGMGFDFQLDTLIPRELSHPEKISLLSFELQNVLKGDWGSSLTQTHLKVTRPLQMRPQAVVIASSTGGPDALEVMFSCVNQTRIPIFIVQHMPPSFTKTLAERLERISGISATEGIHGETPQAGRIYIAPGDFHMSLVDKDNKLQIVLDKDPHIHSVRPSAEKLIASAAHVYGPDLVVFVLTGMGEDGKSACQTVKQRHGAVILQDKETSVVWGMPGAVYATGAYDLVISIAECAQLLKQFCI